MKPASVPMNESQRIAALSSPCWRHFLTCVATFLFVFGSSAQAQEPTDRIVAFDQPRPFDFLLEADFDFSSEEVSVLSYDGFGDVLAHNLATSTFTPQNISVSFSIAGLASDGSRYYSVLESNDNRETNEVYIITYDSLGDVRSNTQVSGSFTPLNISSSVSIAGLASDGSRFYMLLEDNEDEVGELVYLFTFDSVDDLLSSSFSSIALLPQNSGNSFSIKGLASDGAKFYLVMESNEDRNTNEIFVITYNSFNDFVAGNQAAAAYTPLNLFWSYSTAGFASGLPFLTDGPDGSDLSTWSSTLGHEVAVSLPEGAGYDFSEATRGFATHGDLYFLFQSGSRRFWANNQGMQGFVDMGVTTGPLETVAIPEGGYVKQSTEAIAGHTYVSKAELDDAPDQYIVFRVSDVDDTQVTLEYCVRWLGVL